MLFGKKKKGGHGSSLDPNGWMMSYADMATILLAMFIVLSTFAQDQSGISLYAGTGSFKAAMKNFGMPGLTPNSATNVPLKSPGPQHVYEASGEWKKNQPQDADSVSRVIDAEEENLQRFLDEISRAFRLEKPNRTAGQVSIDLFDPLDKAAPYLTDAHRPQVLPLLALLRNPRYQLQVVVWAGTPSDSATIRSANQANAIVLELAKGADLAPEERQRLIGVGQSWKYRDVKRPVVSVVVTKSE